MKIIPCRQCGKWNPTESKKCSECGHLIFLCDAEERGLKEGVVE